MFQAVYESAWHHPVVCFAGVVALLSLVARRLPFLTAYLILFALEIAADALVTGAWTPTTPATKQPLAIAFVILGDFRYLLLFERYTRLTPGQGGLGPPKSGRFWLTASALAFVVPLTQTALLKTMPAVFADPVWIFLVYELLFAALTTILLLVVLPRRMPAPSPERRFVRAISIFFLVQYLLWASADVLTLAGSDYGLLLRLVPNTLYYAGFLLCVWWWAPDAPPRRGGVVWTVAGLAFALALSLIGGRQATRDTDGLRFIVDGEPLRALDRDALPKPVTFTAFDPYYGRDKTWQAIPIAPLLEQGFSGARDPAALIDAEFLLRAADGYAVHLSGARLIGEPGAYVAVADVDVPGWAPIGPQKANPGPFYLVWREPHQQDTVAYPRPWQLESIEIVRFEDAYPNTAPEGVAGDSLAARGYALFGAQCIRCHAINRAGGRVGPELNLPRNVLEYRDPDDLRAFIRDPYALRYGNMPQNPQLTDADLDALIAYLDAMRTRKRDPEAEEAT